MGTITGRYTPQEVQYLKDNYNLMTRSDFALEFNREEDSIRHKLKAMGLESTTISKGVRKYISSGIKRMRTEGDNGGRLRLLNFINSQYTDKNYDHVSRAFIDLGRYEILNSYRRHSA